MLTELAEQKKKRQRHMTLEILVLAWDRHKHVYINSICHMTTQVLTNCRNPGPGLGQTQTCLYKLNMSHDYSGTY